LCSWLLAESSNLGNLWFSHAEKLHQVDLDISPRLLEIDGRDSDPVAAVEGEDVVETVTVRRVEQHAFRVI
jgi:hypothetical protein